MRLFIFIFAEDLFDTKLGLRVLTKLRDQSLVLLLDGHGVPEYCLIFNYEGGVLLFELIMFKLRMLELLLKADQELGV